MRVLTHSLAFLLEVGLLYAVVLSGFQLGGGGAPGILAAVAAGAALVAVWGVYAAPKSRRRLFGPALLTLKAGLFAIGTLALLLTVSNLAAAQFGAIALLYLGLASKFRML